jgi:hypothetical protein
MTLNVYDDQGNITKTCEAEFVDIKFGTVRALMNLLKIEDDIDGAVLLKTVYEAWDQITKVLNRCFPEMTDEDWDNVDVSEVVPVIVDIAKTAFTKMLDIPVEKNVKRA